MEHVTVWAIAPREVHVWLTTLSISAARLASLTTSLSEDERDRAQRLRRHAERNRFMAARGVLRRVLASYLDAAPADVRFAYGPMGQPTLADAGSSPDIRFSLSHSRDLLMLGFAAGRPVGVDVEPVRPLAHREAIERRVFTPRERRSLAGVPDERRLRAFFNGWTRKEAFAKATGHGMWATMGRVEVSLDPEDPAAFLSVDHSAAAAARWTLFHLEPASGFLAAVASEGSDLTLSVGELEPDGLEELTRRPAAPEAGK
ncbi:MAG: 4'-phosphopantetheinyl transferase superfamily protein [Gemmatimonadota bacterium]|nr:MAG: 4'-phosphopantetheinyl transferase superfamily protein [Gemmatimonadota bacterium]